MPPNRFTQNHWLDLASQAEAVPDISPLADALRSSAYLPLRTIRLSVVDGAVILQGDVPTYHCKQVAQSLAQANLPVCEIDNQIQVSEKSPSSG